MLESMRVSDLHQILHYADEQRFGKKCMLIKRCAALLHNQGLNIEDKIKEIYESRNLGQKGIPRPVLRIDRPKTMTTKVPIRPDVKFVPLAFYDFVGEILRPLTLYSNEDLNNASVTGTEVRAIPGNHQTHLQFFLSPQEAQDLATSRFWSDDTESWQFSLHIQLRFCKIGEQKLSEVEDNIPPNLYVLVNNRIVNLPQPKPTSKPNAEIIRPGRPLDLTEHCRLSPTLCNIVEIGWSTGLSSESPLSTYCATISMVRKLTVDTLIRRIRFERSSNSSTDMTKLLIREKLGITNSNDNTSGLLQITTSTLHASLLCPLSKCRIQLPARTINCRHIQCFDLEVYLRMNEKRPTWTCPVCDRKSNYTHLIIDWLFLKVLNTCPDTNAVEFDKDCNFVPISADVKPFKKKSECLPTVSSVSGNDTSLVVLSDDNDDTMYDKASLMSTDEHKFLVKNKPGHTYNWIPSMALGRKRPSTVDHNDDSNDIITID